MRFRRALPWVAAVLPLIALAALLIWLNLPASNTRTVRQPAPPPGSTATTPPAETATPVPSPTEEPTPAATALTLYYAPQPVRFAIPRLKIDAPITQGGLDAAGNMENPKGPDEVMWYTFSVTPGSNGNALLSGHRDFAGSGRPRAAVFWRLPEVQVGDEILIRTETGEEFKFVVEETQDFETDNVPLEYVHMQSVDKLITIITCEGYFNPVTHDYDHRRIVRARLT